VSRAGRQPPRLDPARDAPAGSAPAEPGPQSRSSLRRHACDPGQATASRIPPAQSLRRDRPGCRRGLAEAWSPLSP